MDVISKLQRIFHDDFDDESIVLTKETSPDDVEGWDSLAQINIIVACESEFGIKFGLSDIFNLKTVGAIVDTIARKVKY